MEGRRRVSYEKRRKVELLLNGSGAHFKHWSKRIDNRWRSINDNQ